MNSEELFNKVSTGIATNREKVLLLNFCLANAKLYYYSQFVDYPESLYLSNFYEKVVNDTYNTLVNQSEGLYSEWVFALVQEDLVPIITPNCSKCRKGVILLSELQSVCGIDSVLSDKTANQLKKYDIKSVQFLHLDSRNGDIFRNLTLSQKKHNWTLIASGVIVASISLCLLSRQIFH